MPSDTARDPAAVNARTSPASNAEPRARDTNRNDRRCDTDNPRPDRTNRVKRRRSPPDNPRNESRPEPTTDDGRDSCAVPRPEAATAGPAADAAELAPAGTVSPAAINPDTTPNTTTRSSSRTRTNTPLPRSRLPVTPDAARSTST